MNPTSPDAIKVLLVEDNPGDALLVQRQFIDIPTVVLITVTTVDDALKALKSGEFDVLLSDYLLTGANGATLLQRAREQGFDRPCVFLSGHGAVAAPAAIAAGAHTLIYKETMSGEALHVALQCAHETYKRSARTERLAMNDETTGVLNRRGFDLALAKAVSRQRRHPNGTLAVLFGDVDGLKVLNDAHGHAAGDYLLATIATRMQSCVRTSDAVGRMGGDEFAVVVEGLTDPSHVQNVIDKIRFNIGMPATFGEVLLTPSMSLGYAVYGPECDDVSRLIDAADAAMYEEKRASADRFRQTLLPRRRSS